MLVSKDNMLQTTGNSDFLWQETETVLGKTENRYICADWIIPIKCVLTFYK